MSTHWHILPSLWCGARPYVNGRLMANRMRQLDLGPYMDAFRTDLKGEAGFPNDVVVKVIVCSAAEVFLMTTMPETKRWGEYRSHFFDIPGISFMVDVGGKGAAAPVPSPVDEEALSESGPADRMPASHEGGARGCIAPPTVNGRDHPRVGQRDDAEALCELQHAEWRETRRLAASAASKTDVGVPLDHQKQTFFYRYSIWGHLEIHLENDPFQTSRRRLSH